MDLIRVILPWLAFLIGVKAIGALVKTELDWNRQGLPRRKITTYLAWTATLATRPGSKVPDYRPTGAPPALWHIWVAAFWTFVFLVGAIATTIAVLS